ncbi:MAG: DUF1643 domain-containing protein [Pseudoclavibacter sp.]
MIPYPCGEEADFWDPDPAEVGLRFALGRIGGCSAVSPPFVVIGMNPSHARESESDRTVNHVIDVSKREHLGWLMLNLYPERSPKPKALRPYDAGLSAANCETIEPVLSQVGATEVLGAWGNMGGSATLKRALTDVRELLHRMGVRIYTLDPPAHHGQPGPPAPARATPADDRAEEVLAMNTASGSNRGQREKRRLRPIRALRSARGWIVVLVPLLAIVAGGYLLFMAAVGMTSGMPPWAAIAICFVVPITVCSGLGSWAHRLGSPRSWLVAAGGGTLLIVAPLLVRWVLGSWSASFAMPSRRGRSSWVDVSDYACWSLAVGGALVAMGLIGYVIGGRNKIGERLGQRRRVSRR